ncbi:uncharacterized protein LOC123009323 [Tribolium madens]|uniref:uncharacterized protein LOC123009323 n=1 Tax=Tribolium madens TaxID=41895 RepID=UPI001CF749D9|nr:uncharacterized protein LOC123009323 [Tribolium madens]
MSLFCVIFFIFLTLDFSIGCNTNLCPIARKLQSEKPVTKPLSATCNNGKGEKIAIGIETINICYGTSFTKKIIVCVKNTMPLQKTYWAKHKIEKEYKSCPEKASKPSWKTDNLQGDVDLFYKTIRNYEGETYDKGHLAPRCDFNTEIDRSMTFFYINAAPQWSSFNKGIWRNLEQGVRDQTTPDPPQYVITGTVGSRNLNSSHNLINIPKYFYKIVLPEPVVYIGFNYNNTSEERLCQPLNFCKFLQVQNKKIYCCKLNDDLMGKLGLEEKDLTKDLN